ncbi:CGNR zinc finger domain-containing protein [Microbacterium sp. NPDC090218]
MPPTSEATDSGSRPLGLRFVVDVLNASPETWVELQHLMREHHGPHIDVAAFDSDEFGRAIDAVRQIFAADDDTEAASRINQLLLDVNVPTELDRLDDGRWALRPAISADASLAPWFAATAAFGLGLWMTERGRPAWGECAAPDCSKVFVDAGRRRPQQYCSTRCATRVRVSAHRESARPGSA